MDQAPPTPPRRGLYIGLGVLALFVIIGVVLAFVLTRKSPASPAPASTTPTQNIQNLISVYKEIRSSANGEVCTQDVYLPVAQWADSQGAIAQSIGTPCSQGMTSSFETATLRLCIPQGVDEKLNNIPQNLIDQVDSSQCVKQAIQAQQTRNEAIKQANANKMMQLSEQAQKTAVDGGGRDVGAYTKADYTEVAAPLKELNLIKQTDFKEFPLDEQALNRSNIGRGEAFVSPLDFGGEKAYTEVAAPLKEVRGDGDTGAYGGKPKIAAISKIDEKDYFSKQKVYKQSQMGSSYEV
jgi:uncharacterized membrane protein